MRSRTIALLVLLALAAGCSEERPGKEVVTSNHELQVKYLAAHRALGEIKALRKRKRDFSADCKTMQLIFLSDLKKLKAPAAKRLVSEIITTCQGTTFR